MSLEKILSIASSGMSAQTVRLSTVASNLANVDTAASSEADAYHAREPIFQSNYSNELMGMLGNGGGNGINGETNVGVQVASIAQSDAPIQKEYKPDHPQADQDGYVYYSNVNQVDEMTNMIDASRQYRVNVEVMNTSKTLLQRTIGLLDQ